MGFYEVVSDICATIVFVLVLALVVFGGDKLVHYKEYQQQKKEWKYKVQQCIINKNFRKDCEYIIYRDAQINSYNTHYTPVPVTVVVPR